MINSEARTCFPSGIPPEGRGLEMSLCGTGASQRKRTQPTAAAHSPRFSYFLRLFVASRERNFSRVGMACGPTGDLLGSSIVVFTDMVRSPPKGRNGPARSF